jgi:hypothetical protein
MDAGLEEHLVCVQVADAGDDLLNQEPDIERPRQNEAISSAEHPSKMLSSMTVTERTLALSIPARHLRERSRPREAQACST